MFNRPNVKHRSLAVIVAGTCGLCGVARAQSEYSFTYSDSITSAAGWLRTNAAPLSDGGFSVTEGALNVSSGPLAGAYELVPNAGAPGTVYSPMGKFIFDSVLFPQASANLDYYGLLFAANGREVNIWGNGAQPYSMWSSAGGGYDYSNDAGSFVLSESGGAVPAPGTSAVALVAMVFVTRRRRHPTR